MSKTSDDSLLAGRSSQITHLCHKALARFEPITYRLADRKALSLDYHAYTIRCSDFCRTEPTTSLSIIIESYTHILIRKKERHIYRGKSSGIQSFTMCVPLYMLQGYSYTAPEEAGYPKSSHLLKRRMSHNLLLRGVKIQSGIEKNAVTILLFVTRLLKISG